MFINFPGQNARTWGRSLGGSPQLVSGAMTPVVTGLTPLTLLTSGVIPSGKLTVRPWQSSGLED